MKKKTRRTLIILLLFLATATWTWRYVSLNNYYSSMSDRTKKVYSTGEIVPFDKDFTAEDEQPNGYSLRVDSFEIVDYDSYIEETSIVGGAYGPQKLALVHITLFNDDSNTDGILLTAFQLHGIDNYVGLDRTLLTVINPVLEGYYGIRLRPGEEYELTIPYDMSSNLFGSDTWKHLNEYAFYFHITSYPTEKDIQVQ